MNTASGVSSRRGQRGPRLGSLTSAVILYLACSSFLHRRLLARLGSSILETQGSPATSRDPALFVWWVRWIPYAVLHGHNPLYTTRINYPVGGNAMWNTTVPLLGAIASPITLTAGPIAATNMLFVLGPVVSALAAFFVMRRYTRSDVACLVGGLVYGFSPYFAGQGLGHLHLVWGVFPPLLVVLLDEILVRQRFSPTLVGSALGLACAMQVLVSTEVLALGFLVAGVACVVMAASWPRKVGQKAPYALLALGVGVVVTLAVAGWPLWTVAFGPNRPSGFVQPPGVNVADPLSFVVPTKNLLLSPNVFKHVVSRFPSNISEETSYLGVPLMVLLVAFTIWKWRSALVRVVALTGVAAAVGSLGPWPTVLGHRVKGIPLPWRAVQYNPLFMNAEPVRLSLFVAIAAAILVALALDSFLELRGVKKWLGVVAVTVALVPLLPVSYTAARLPSTPPLFTTEAHLIPSDSVLVIEPYPYQLGMSFVPMLWQARAGLRFSMPGGPVFAHPAHKSPYAPFEPERTSLRDASIALEEGRVPALTAPLRSRLLADLRRLHPSMIVVAPSPFVNSALAFFESLLGRPPQRLAGTWVFRLAPGDLDR